jgi:hypothetical protein
LPENITVGSKEAEEFLGGAKEFNITEIEVYQIY